MDFLGRNNEKSSNEDKSNIFNKQSHQSASYFANQKCHPELVSGSIQHCIYTSPIIKMLK